MPAEGHDAFTLCIFFYIERIKQTHYFTTIRNEKFWHELPRNNQKSKLKNECARYTVVEIVNIYTKQS
jgi:hypothetical protein